MKSTIAEILLLALLCALPAQAEVMIDKKDRNYECEYHQQFNRQLCKCGWTNVVNYDWECSTYRYESGFPFYAGFQQICYSFEWTVISDNEAFY